MSVTISLDLTINFSETSSTRKHWIALAFFVAGLFLVSPPAYGAEPSQSGERFFVGVSLDLCMPTKIKFNPGTLHLNNGVVSYGGCISTVCEVKI